VVHFRGRIKLLNICHHVQPGGLCQVRSVKRNSLEILDGLNLVFLIHNGKEIIVAAVRINPDGWGDHLVRCECGDDVRDNFFFGEAEFARSHAIDGNTKGWIVEILRNINIGNTFDATQLRSHLLRRVIVGIHVISYYTDIDRCGRTHIQNTVDQAST